jgi:phosphatidylglycerophosphate synthase
MPDMKVRHATSLALAEKVGKNTISKTGIAILFVIVISALCVAVYEAWLDMFQAEAILVVMVMVVVGLVVMGKEGD